MVFVDTHCHIHDSEFQEKYIETPDELVEESVNAGVTKLICVGTTLQSSKEAVEFGKKHRSCYPAVALHPHEAEFYSLDQIKEMMSELDESIEAAKSTANPVIAIGETGLDHYYHESGEIKKIQLEMFRMHLELAKKHDLPLIFHIREAFKEFFAVLDEFEGVRGVVHSFTANTAEMEECVKRGLYVGLNGIMTFTKVESQLDAAKALPLSKLLLETDAPFLTPKPFRGKMCKPKHVKLTAEFLSELRGESLEVIADQTTKNASDLFAMGDK